jgi:RND family efflux transporter MFP subunit
VDALLQAGLNNAAWAAALALLAALASRAWRDRPALVHGLWLLVLLKLATPSLVILPLLHSSDGPSPQPSPAGRGSASNPLSPRERVPEGRVRERLVEPDTALPAPVPAVFPDPEPVRPQAAPWPWRQALAMTWLAGAGVWWAAVGLQTSRFGRLLRSARPANDSIRDRARAVAARLGLGRCPEVWVVPARIPPMLWALVGPPRLVLPEALWDGMEEDERDAVLAHELAHLKRRDHWVRRLEALVLGIYWWDPVAWWARREVERAEEESCDAWVAWALPGSAPSYAEALVKTADFLSGPRPPWPAGASGSGRIPLLKRRLSMILRGPESGPMSRPASRTLVVLAAMALPLLPTWAAVPPASIPDQEPAPKAAPPPEQKKVVVDPTTGPQAKAGDHPPPRKGEARRDNVKVIHPIVREVRDYADFMGRTAVTQSAEIRARVGGTIVKANVPPGVMVKRGDVLFELDPTARQLALDKAEAQVKRAQAQRRQALAVVARNRDLNKKNAAYVAKADIEKAEGELDAAEAEIKIAEGSRDLARLELSYTRVTAPIDGLVSQVLFFTGNVVAADTTPLATVVSPDPILVFFEIDERTVLRLNRLKREGKARFGLEPGLPISMALADEDGFPRQSSIDTVDSRFDPGKATLLVRAKFPNPDREIVPGMSARVRLTIGEPREAMLLPVSAVATVQEQYAPTRTRGVPGVHVVTEGDLVEHRKINIGPVHGDFREVVEGLKAGEWVVEDARGNRFPPGTKIQPLRVEAPPSP